VLGVRKYSRERKTFVNPGRDEGRRFHHTRALLGHYMEYTWMTDFAWQRIGGR
jgi:hypothetical protein